MSSITINSNIASLNAQRRLGVSTADLRDSFTRLSSGLRINRARDDASGLAISSDLKVDARVFSQGVRNINDAVGLLNIAESASRELTSILVRQRELATQASNGTLSSSQRASLDEEANALVDEYNRIIATVEFNDSKLLNGDVESLRIQAGYGENGSISFGLGTGLSRSTNDGTFQSEVTYGNGDDVLDLISGDLNNDGFADVAYTNYAEDSISIMLGNGDGTLQAAVSYVSGNAPFAIELSDVNNDGALDMISSVNQDSSVSVLLNNGDGTFRAFSAYTTGANSIALSIGDVNGDNIDDIAATSTALDAVSVLLGNADGSFRAASNFDVGTNPEHVILADLNGDAILDVVTSNDGSDDLTILLGNGDGSFKALSSISTANGPRQVEAGDLNGDGIIDLVTAEQYGPRVGVFIGVGDGTFNPVVTVQAGSRPAFLTLDDVSGDGVLDIAVLDFTDDTLNVLIGNGNGSFQADTTYNVGQQPSSVVLADLDSDGPLDFIVANFQDNTISILLGNGQDVSTQESLDLSTRDAALESIDVIDSALERIGVELGGIGATQSRLATAVRNLQVSRENFISAASQITDVDVGEETARLVRNQILQQAGAAVLAQANQAPALASRLIG